MMADTSRDMLLDETTVIDSDSGSITRDSISCQDTTRNESLREERQRKHNDDDNSHTATVLEETINRSHRLNHNNRVHISIPGSPLSDSDSCTRESRRQRNQTTDNDETRCSDLDSSCSTTRIRENQPVFDYSATKEPSSRDSCASYMGNPASLDGSNQKSRRSTQQQVRQAFLVDKPVHVEWHRQREYDEFQVKFKGLVSNFERRNPRTSLREYTSMSSQQQRGEHDKVVALLDRLGIDAGSNKENINEARSPRSSVRDAARESSPSSFQSSKISRSRSIDSIDTPPRAAERQRNPFSDSQLSPIVASGNNDESMVGACSDPCQLPKQEGSPMSFQARGDSFQDVSVETTRQAASSSPRSMYGSPPLQESHQHNTHKRLASTSGKRGKDSFRMRYSSDSCVGCAPNANASQSSEQSISFVAPEDAYTHPFAASQSPIAGTQYNPPDAHMSPEVSPSASPAISKRGGRKHNSRHRRDLHQSTNIAEFTRFDMRANPRWKQVSASVGLREGASVHYNPLQLKTSKRSFAQERRKEQTFSLSQQPKEFRDPLKAFIGRGGETLHRVFDWIRRRDDNCTNNDNKWNSDCKGVVFSLEPVQIVSIVMKLLLENESISHERIDFDVSLAGQTLIVVRSKEDIPIWERAFREHTPFAVSSHADLPSSEKKQTGAASKCATFDIVLTTFDALKSADITIKLDDDDHAVVKQGAESQSVGAWMSKRTSNGNSQRFQSQGVGNAAKCKKLSALHAVFWRRIVFVDDLAGRKCFLAKAGTARADAAKALGGAARFVFFPKEKNSPDSSSSGFETLLKCDRRAFESVAGVLRVDFDEDEDEDDNHDLMDCMIDALMDG
ncbi:expressed unknown protein [Seminavis robusta]|uniref:Uncharacterized protein n=1 Tax=Seminavis robusta TaxID=568900 RepID=A0A9N8HH47_9STRA|nr:expressed unknown protein [Seminavis robusta]|eukprot:Sro518_g158820.1 n/a (847) ;mRNA; f:31081-33717